MKVNTYETDCAFGFNFIVENLEDAAWVVRFRRNVKKEMPIFGANVSQKGEFKQWFSFQRKVEKTSAI